MSETVTLRDRRISDMIGEGLDTRQQHCSIKHSSQSDMVATSFMWLLTQTLVTQ